MKSIITKDFMESDKYVVKYEKEIAHSDYLGHKTSRDSSQLKTILELDFPIENVRIGRFKESSIKRKFRKKSESAQTVIKRGAILI